MKRDNHMKKIVALTLCVILAAVFVTGCVSINYSGTAGGGVTGRGSMETITIPVGVITEVRVELLCNIEYFSSPSDTATFQIQSNLMEYINIEENEGILTVRSTRNINVSGTANTPVLTVYAPLLTRVNHAGAGNFTANDPIKVNDFTLGIAGAANAVAELDVQNLTITLAGAGKIDLSGTADTANISIAGAGTLDALDLETRVTSIDLAGVGSVRIGCSEKLSVTAGGVGSVEYRGSPTLDLTRGGLVTVTQVS